MFYCPLFVSLLFTLSSATPWSANYVAGPSLLSSESGQANASSEYTALPTAEVFTVKGGYEIHTGNTTLIAPNVPSTLVCNGRFSDDVLTDHTRVHSRLIPLIGGLTGFIFGLITVAFYPALLKILKNTNHLVTSDRAQEFNKRINCDVNGVFLIVGGVLSVALYSFLGVVIGTSVAGVQTEDRQQDCYRIVQPNGIRLLSDTPQATDSGTVSYDQEAREVVIATTCGSTLVEVGCNHTWHVSPAVKTTCTPVSASILKKLTYGHTSRCKGAGSEPKQPPGTQGWKMNTISRGNWPNCFLSTRYTHGWYAWEGETANDWQFCTVSNQAVVVTRDGQTVDSGVVTPLLTVDPNTARPYGWWTNGAQTVVATSNDDDGIEASISFGHSLEEMASSHLVGWQHDADPAMSRVQGSKLNTADFECKMLIRVKGEFEEFAEPCASLTAYKDGNQSRVYNPSERLCSFKWAMLPNATPSDYFLPVRGSLTFATAGYWSCTESGLDCSQDLLSPVMGQEYQSKFVAATVPSVASSSGSNTDSLIPDFANLWDDTFLFVVLAIGGIIIVGAVIAVIVRCRNQKAQSTAIAALVAKKATKKQRESSDPLDDL